MKRHVYVRPARPEDASLVVKWSAETANNLWDPEIGKHPGTVTLCAYDAEGPLVFMPVQRALMLEALAIRPGASGMDVAVALKELTQACVTMAHAGGAAECYFICKDPSTEAFAAHQVFEKLPWAVYRLRLSDLEKPHGEDNH